MDWQSVRTPHHLSLPDKVSLELERLIFSDQIKAGEKLPPERELSTLFDVSRSSVRQALTSLEDRNLVKRTPGLGTVIVGPEHQTSLVTGALDLLNKVEPKLSYIMELRAAIEPPIARLAATRAQKRDHVHLHEILIQMEATPNKEEYAELDRIFHEAIAQCSYNPLLIAINSHIANQIMPSRADRYQNKQRRKISTQAHYRIYNAIVKHDGLLAEESVRDHILDIANTIAAELIQPAEDTDTVQQL